MARELQPQNIHVAQVVIDGGICDPALPSTPRRAVPMAASTPTRLRKRISNFTGNIAVLGHRTLNCGHVGEKF